MSEHQYDESKIKTLSSLEHIRKRPGMYIGRLGNGSDPDDGIYYLTKTAGLLAYFLHLLFGRENPGSDPFVPMIRTCNFPVLLPRGSVTLYT